MRDVLVTGGAGFIGVNFVRWVLACDPDVRIVNLDLLTYAGNLESLADVFRRYGPDGGGDGRHFFIRADVRDFETLRRVLAGEATETPMAAPSRGASRPPTPSSTWPPSRTSTARSWGRPCLWTRTCGAR